ncbi:MAG: hypothetical protein HY296_04500 [Thaumarchaeota archaeon]|nr:hypothetical protein [Nitrososphaerota archaeon]
MGKTAVALFVGLLLIFVSYWNVSGMKSMRTIVPLVGLLASFVGALDTIPLVTIFAGVNFSLLGGQPTVSQLMLDSGAILALFVGFPLGVMSSIGGLAKAADNTARPSESTQRP